MIADRSVSAVEPSVWMRTLVSADTLNYFGDLRPVYEAAAVALRPGGRVVFTLERADDLPAAGGSRRFKLNAHGRYSHRESDTRALLDECGLRVQSLTVEVLRKEAGEPVGGLLVVAGRD